MNLDPWYYDFLFDADHAATTTAQVRCGLSIEEVISLTTRPRDEAQPQKPR